MSCPAERGAWQRLQLNAPAAMSVLQRDAVGITSTDQGTPQLRARATAEMDGARIPVLHSGEQKLTS